MRELLGEPKPELPMDDPEAEAWLMDEIPEAADDHAIRLPLPRVAMPVLED